MVGIGFEVRWGNQGVNDHTFHRGFPEWGGDRLVRGEDDAQLLSTTYEPDSFIPLLRLHHNKARRRTIDRT